MSTPQSPSRIVRKKLSRREFLWSSSLLTTSALLAACGAPAADAPAAESTAAPVVATSASAAPASPDGYGEAPMLAERVAAGDLPPVAERLPETPLVWDAPDINAFETEEGRYGSTIRVGNASDISVMASIGFARVSSDRTTYYPDIAESWEVSDDATQWTFHLRPGMKWSDGEPFTANDIIFWWNDIAQSKYQAAPIAIGGMNPTTDKIVMVDDLTLRFEFAQPAPLFLYRSRGVQGGGPSTIMSFAAHYGKQFHPDYTPVDGKDPQEQFDEMIDAASFPRILEDPNRPVLWAFRPLEYQEGQLARLERNPYFWTVDKQGRQLPYLDYFESAMLTDSDAEVIKLKLLAGETHWELRRVNVTDIPLFRENEESAQVDVILPRNPVGSNCALVFNSAHPNPKMRALMDQADFRRALSIAVDRETINQTALFGIGTAGHGLSSPGEYDPEIDGLWAQYDPETSKQMLDAIGLDQTDSEGFRTYPDGEELTLVIDLQPGWGLMSDQTVEITAEAWNALGIRTVVKSNEGRIHSENFNNQSFDVWQEFWWGGAWDLDFTYGTGAGRWAKAQAKWWRTRDSGSPEGEEPTGFIRELLELEDVAFSTTDEAERQQAVQRHREIVAENIPGMGFVQNIPVVHIASKKLRGVWGRNEDYLWIHSAGGSDIWPRSWFMVE